MRIFAAVADCMSFTEAAYSLGISQPAVSQAVERLERELGARLVVREKRKIALTPAGGYFAAESRRILKECDALFENIRSAHFGAREVIRIAFINVYRGQELERAVARFTAAHPQAAIEVQSLSHEQIYEGLMEGGIDLALSDQRRAFSSDFENLELAQTPVYAELASHLPQAAQKRVTAASLRGLSCILVAGASHREAEKNYFAGLLGFKGEFVFADTLAAARLTAASGRGFLLSQGVWRSEAASSATGAATVCVPIFKAGALVRERFCAFCLKNKSTPLIEAFFATLENEFAAGPRQAAAGA